MAMRKMRYLGEAPVDVVGVCGTVHKGDVVDVPSHRAAALSPTVWEVVDGAAQPAPDKEAEPVDDVSMSTENTWKAPPTQHRRQGKRINKRG